MNPSQYIPYTAYTASPYPPRFGAPGYQNIPAMAAAQGTPVAYPPPAFAGGYPPNQQKPQQQYVHPQQLQISPSSPWQYGYAPVAGQVEDIVSPGSSAGGMQTTPTPVHAHPSRGMPMGATHPSSMPQVQDVFAPRQSAHSPYGQVQMPTQMPNGNSRMVGAYPPLQAPTPPIIAMPQRPMDTVAQLMINAGFPPPRAGGGQQVMMGADSGGMGHLQQGEGGGYNNFSLSP
ncbi:hypothetical protein B0H66DRAFT_630426 [Apodospora peruviana]|uniref:Uncharacterized protein n=1 Tax=Apodospora peruviana TaxID=516989 RepID=A0AAE0HY01_9PEZI|nr:hypothetical protein B0H66DRAFT_630426 [Apodospora peruviana]